MLKLQYEEMFWMETAEGIPGNSAIIVEYAQLYVISLICKLCNLRGIANAAVESADWCERATEHAIYAIFLHFSPPGLLCTYLFF